MTATLTPIPSATKIPPVSLTTAYANFERMTVLQFNEYMLSIAGKSVRQIVTIGNVDDYGRVSLSGPWSPAFINISDFGVVVVGVPHEVAITLDGGDTIYLEATIDRIVGDYNFYTNRENMLVLDYQSFGKD